MKHDLTWPRPLLDRLATEAQRCLHDNAVGVREIKHRHGRVTKVRAGWQERGPNYAIVEFWIGADGATIEQTVHRPLVRTQA